MARIFCIHCSQEIIPSTARFCPHCGQPRGALTRTVAKQRELVDEIDINDAVDVLEAAAAETQSSDDTMPVDMATAAALARRLRSKKRGLRNVLEERLREEMDIDECRGETIQGIAFSSPGTLREQRPASMTATEAAQQVLSGSPTTRESARPSKSSKRGNIKSIKRPRQPRG